jgi:predicted GNAT family N-acyltransferase
LILFDVNIVTTSREREDAFSVRRKVFVEEQGVPLSLELDELDETADHFVVYTENAPIGAGRIRESDSGIGKVERVCILPEYRGKHLGKLIMQALEDHAASKGFEKIVLNAQSYAIPFYEKIGYVITSPEFMDADIPHRTMEKTIIK